MLENVQNLGPVSAKWLEEAGIRDLDEIKRLGAVVIFLRVQQLGHPVSKNFLWALEGAIQDLDWRTVDATTKKRRLSELARMRN